MVFTDLRGFINVSDSLIVARGPQNSLARHPPPPAQELTPTDHLALATTNNKTNLCTVDGIGRYYHFSESMDGVKNCY